MLEIKEVARQVTGEMSLHIANKALEMDSAEEIEKLLMALHPMKQA
jgi:hypothetical protein